MHILSPGVRCGGIAALLFSLFSSAIVNGQCTSSACTGTSISGSSNYTIPSGTTYYVAAGNTWSGNVTFTNSTSVLCIEGTWTGKMAVASSAAGTINVRDGGVVNNGSTWSHNGGGPVNININTGATFTVTAFSFSGGTYTITNCGILTFTGNSSSNGGTITINNYGTFDLKGTFSNSGASWVFDNKAGGVLKSAVAGTALSFSNGAFINSGEYCFANNITYNGGTLTNNGCISMSDYTTNTASGLVNNGVMKVSGNFSNSGAGQANNSLLVVTGNFSNSGASFVNDGTINITGNFSNSGASMTLYDKSLITCADWTSNGTFVGPAAGCASMRATGVTTFSGTFGTNSSRIDMYDTGLPSPKGSPAFPLDVNTGNAGSATATGTCATNSFTDDCSAQCSAVLPIELLSFTAHPSGDQVIVRWVTASEINNDYFTVERSTDGTRFEAAGLVSGHGNSTVTLSYTFTDDSPYTGTSYYRLRQTDYDGRSETFAPVAVTFEAEGSEARLLTLYPNPSAGHLSLSLFAPEATILRVEVLDATGRVLYASEEVTDKGTSSLPLDVSSLSRGLYFVKITHAGGTDSRRFIRN